MLQMPTSMPSSCYEPHGLSVELHSILWPSQMAHHWIHRITPLDFWNVSWWCSLSGKFRMFGCLQLESMGCPAYSYCCNFWSPLAGIRNLDPYVVKMPGNTQHIANSRNFIQPLSLAAKMQQNRNRKHRNLLVMNLGTLILVKFPIQRKQENLHCHPQFLNSFNYVFFMAPENLQSSFARKRQPSVSRSQHIDLPSNWKWILRANHHRCTMIHIYDLATM